ncbi:MAG TPA: hypothetical protein VJ991_15440 [Balneolales bacterium]|nr:hypothetical protein [Balneolales bacterium]
MKFGPLVGKTPKHKRFEYQPRYYKPDKKKKDLHDIKFERKTHRGQVRSIVLYAALLFLVFWLILHLA